MKIINLYGNHVQKYAYSLISQQMDLDKFSGYKWKLLLERGEKVEAGSIYAKISLSAYYNLEKGVASDKMVARVLNYYNIKHGVYCEHKQK